MQAEFVNCRTADDILGKSLELAGEIAAWLVKNGLFQSLRRIQHE